MSLSIVNPQDSLERQNEKLLKIASALMRRVELASVDSGEAFAHFERALMLEAEVRARTRELEQTLTLLNESNARLSQAMEDAEQARSDLYDAIEAVKEGFALFDSREVLVMFNSRFAQTLPDVAEKLGPGLKFVDYVRFVSQSRHIVFPEGMTREEWARHRLETHRKQSVNFNVRIEGDRWLQVSEQRTPGGGTAMLQTEITELIKMERQERDKLLDEQARLVRATLDHIDQGICIFDSDLLLVGWNNRLRELLSPPMQILRVGTPFSVFAEHFRRSRIFEGKTGPEQLSRWVMKKGVRSPLSVELRTCDNVFLDVFGQEMPNRGFVISFTDVTAEREAQFAMNAANASLERRVQERTNALQDALAEAELANASKSRFVAAASHDLLQPLSAAKLFLASLEQSCAGTGSAETVSRVQSAFESVEGILSALLDISRLDSGSAALKVTSVPLAQVLSQLGQEFGEIARLKGLDLRVVGSRAVVRSDAAYLRRVVQNLLANAVRYTDAGKVLLGVRHSRDSVWIEVWDTGPGIPEAERAAIFGEFHRVGAKSSADEGMGLGLAIVDRACRLLGHDIELVSEVGRGTVFRVRVPLAVGEEDMAPELLTGGAPVNDGPAESGLIILMIENERVVREALSGLLEAWGASVLVAANLAEAQELIDELGLAPDLILADYHLDAGQNGLDAIETIRASLGPVDAVLVTADRSDAVGRRCQAQGVLLLNKPVAPARLRALLASVVPNSDATPM
ncbi:PAS-domain containing protein [Amaricoccus macauensis]|uniref:sensor histidine kinase n=1 Tax=Amaricoccus macauensis TaxID=57001 RepID=UPI003C7A4178